MKVPRRSGSEVGAWKRPTKRENAERFGLCSPSLIRRHVVEKIGRVATVYAAQPTIPSLFAGREACRSREALGSSARIGCRCDVRLLN